MVTVKGYLVNENRDDVYNSLKAMIPTDDLYMHYRLDGMVTDCCYDQYFAAIDEEGKALSRLWMCWGKHKGSVANWGAFFTSPECRGKGIGGKVLDYCFNMVEELPEKPTALFCTAGTLELTNLYRKYGFVTALRGADRGPLYYPMKGAPATFYEFYKNYYTPADTLYRKPADFGYRNEIDCLLKFAMLDMGLDFGINGKMLYEILLEGKETAEVLLTADGKCVGWIYNGITQLYPDYENAKIEE